MSVTFNFQKPVRLPQRRKIKQLVKEIFVDQKRHFLSVEITFCDDAFLLAMNKSYLSHNHLTDIITFDLGDEGVVQGDVYISVDTAEKNAITYNVLLTNELNRLIIHGCLHLCGKDDKISRDKMEMTKLEERYLRKLSDL